MKKIILYLFLSLFNTYAFAQTRFLTIIIDTLTLNQFNSFKLATTRIIIDEEFNKNWEVFDSIDSKNQTIKSYNYPNYLSTVAILNDSTKLIIPLDDGGGYLSILNCYNLKSDTLRIASWSIYSNCFNDTITQSINSWKVKYLGSLSEKPIKNKQKNRTKIQAIKNNCINKPPSQITLLANQIKYEINIGPPKKIEVIYEIACGYKNYKPKWDEKPPKRSVYRTSRMTKTYKTLNILSISLKKGV